MKKFILGAISVILMFVFSLSIPVLATENVLQGKSALFCGDSICYGYGDKSNLTVKGWAGRIGTKNNMDFVNAGLSGASISNIRGENRILNQLIRNSNKQFDFVILHGGVNDAWDVANVGTLKPAGETSNFDLSTFAGGLEQTLNYAKSTFPNAKIGYIINFKASGCNTGVIKQMDEYVNITKAACDKYGIKYLDMYNNEEVTNAMQPLTRRFLPDTIHPNADGYEVLTPFIENFMIELGGGTVNQPPVSSSTESTSSKEESTSSKEEVTSSKVESTSSKEETTESNVNSEEENTTTDDNISEPVVAKTNKTAVWIVVGVVAALVLAGCIVATILIIKSNKR